MNRDTQEQQLWGLLCRGDQEALQKLYMSYYKSLLRYGLTYTDDRETLKDSINSTFLYIWEKRNGLAAANHVGNYIFKSFQRQLAKDIKKSQTFQDLDQHVPPDWALDDQEFNFITQQEENKRMHLLKNAIQKLPKRQRELLHLRYYEELSYDEIVERTQLTKRSVYNQIHTAISTLKADTRLKDLKQLLTLLPFF